MIFAIIIVLILVFLSKQRPAQSSGASPTTTTIIGSNPPSFNQGAVTTGPSREPFQQFWQNFQMDLSALFAPNAFSPQATGQATSSSVEIQNNQLTDFTTVQPGQTPPGGVASPPGGSSSTGGGGSGSSGSISGGGRGGINAPLGGFINQPAPLGAGPGVNTTVAAPTGAAPTTGAPLNPRLRIVTARVGAVK